jgi:hypothetical protein
VASGALVDVGGPVQAVGLTKIPITAQLRQQKSHLETRLKEIDELIDHLEKNPNVQIALDLLSKLGSVHL